MPIREAIARLIAPAPEADPRIEALLTKNAALEARIERLEKRLSMTMGAFQASTAQQAALKAQAEEALRTARQASQIATTARSTAETVADALDELEAGAAEPSPASPDLSVLSGSVGEVKTALDSGAHDAHLDALAAAERGAKNRKGVLAAIAARRD